jgi:hypothetical protein
MSLSQLQFDEEIKTLEHTNFKLIRNGPLISMSPILLNQVIERIQLDNQSNLFCNFKQFIISSNSNEQLNLQTNIKLSTDKNIQNNSITNIQFNEMNMNKLDYNWYCNEQCYQFPLILNYKPLN